METETGRTESVETKKSVQVEKKSQMQVSEDGIYLLNTLSNQMDYAQWLIDKRMVSDTFKTSSQLMVAIQLCKTLKLPLTALSCFYVVGGKPAVYGDVLIGLILSSGLVCDKTVFFFDKDGETINRPKKGQEIFGCEVNYKRVGFDSFVSAFYTMDDKEESATTNPVWRKYHIDMLFRRADIRAIKMLFPDAMRGLEVAEYLQDKEDSSSSVAINSLNESFLKK